MFIWLRRDVVRPIIAREYPCIQSVSKLLWYRSRFDNLSALKFDAY
jgi:hypothetical protein